MSPRKGKKEATKVSPNAKEQKSKAKSKKSPKKNDNVESKAKSPTKNDDEKKKPEPENEVKNEEKPSPAGRGKKRKLDSEPVTDGGKDTPKPKVKRTSSITENFSETDFTAKPKASNGKEANFKIASWNINGIRAWLDKDGPSYLKAEQPDVLCVQELKCENAKIPAEVQVDGYTTHWLSGDTKGYAGVGIYYKTNTAKPIKITDGIGIKKHDDEGRVITAEFEKFYLVGTYIPNAGQGLKRLKYRSKEWDVDFRKYLQSLDEKKPVIWCGDLNVAHNEIDIKNPKTNKKNAGFTQEERDGFTETLGKGFIDTFRHLHPEEENAFTFWTYMMNARAKNVGWRLDYFVMSERFKDHLCDSVIRSKVMGSDHCPIVLHLAL